VGRVHAYSSPVDEEEDFAQQRNLWTLYKKSGEDKNSIHNLSGHVAKELPEVHGKTIEMWNGVDKEIGERLKKALDETHKGKEADHCTSPRAQRALATNRK
jgi:catalase